MKFYQKWQGRNCSEPSVLFKARVPGNIQKDYAEAKGFTDVQFADGYRQFLPIENDAWEYVTKLDYRQKDGEKVFFVSGGIDYRYEILLNGKKIYEYEGMFRPIELDLTDSLDARNENVLTVHIFPHPKSEEGRPGTRDEADHSCKPAVCYGWDWNPRLLISGMYREAYIETRKADGIGKIETSYTLADDFSTAELTVSAENGAKCVLEVFEPDGSLLYRGENKALTISDPKLWWCREHGEQNRYTWRLTAPDGEIREGKVGFRKVRLVRNFKAREESCYPMSRYPAPFTMELNGKKIFLKGANFVNAELFWADADENRYKELLDLVADANMNIIRLWGGTSIHHPALYEICDEMGILVWQEFMLACNCYPDEEQYLKVLESEATAMIKTLRVHPSLVLWCGGNELFNGWSNMTDQSLPLRLLNSLCYLYDKNTPYIPTSPLFGMGHGDYIFYEERQKQDVYQMFSENEHIAFTEFGVPSISSMEILKKIIPADELKEIIPTESWICHHALKAWKSESHADLEVLSKYFGEKATLEERIEQSQWLQCEGLKFIYEEARRSAPRVSAALVWAFNEPWYTAANLGIVSYPATPKPAYYAVKDALRQNSFTAHIEKFDWNGGERFTAGIWLMNDSDKTVTADAEVFLCIGEKKIPLLSWKGATAAPYENVEGASVCCFLPNEPTDRFTLMIRSSDPAFDSAYTLLFRPLTHQPPSRQMNV